MDENNNSENFYFDDINDIKLNESKRKKYLDLISSISNQTSKEEMIKRLR